MTEEERSLLDALDTGLRAENVRKQIGSIVGRVRAELARRKDALMSWEPFPLEVLATSVPTEIRSAWPQIISFGTRTIQ